MKLSYKNLQKRGAARLRPGRLNLYALSAILVLLAMTTSSAMGAFQQQTPLAPDTGTGGWNIQTVGAAGWTPETVDSLPTFRYMTDRSLAFRNDNMPCVVYGGDHLYYACWNPTVSQWQSEVVDSDPLVGAYAALAFNSNSRPFISYYDAANGNLKLAYNLGLGWQKLVVDTNPVALSVAESFADPDLFTSPELRTLYEKLDATPWKDPFKSAELPGTESADITYDGGGVGLHTSIAIDSIDRVHISYYDDDNRDLKYARWDGLTWTIEFVDQEYDQGKVGLWSSIAVDSSNVPQIAYMSEKYDDLKFAWRKGFNQSWDTFTVDSASNVGAFVSLVVDANGYPQMSYMDFANYNLKFARMTGTGPVTWTSGNVATEGSVGWYSSIARDANGKLHISFYDMTGGDLEYASGSGSTWSLKTIYNTGDLGYFTSIAIDKTNLPGIVYGNSTLNALQYTHLTDGKWIASTITIGKTADVGMATSLALNYSGEAYISYLDDSADFMKRAYQWSITDTWYKDFVRTDISAGAYSSMALAYGAVPMIAFYDSTNDDLVLATWVGTGWEFKSVDTGGDVGRFVSLAVDSTGRPHMSYYDATNGDLRYATWNASINNWQITPVDQPGNIGMYTSITLHNDKPYISYYDDSKEMIKYAFQTGTGAWVNFPLDEVGDWLDAVPVEAAYTSIAIGKVHIDENEDGVFDEYVDGVHIAYYCDYYCEYDLPKGIDDDSNLDQDLKYAISPSITPTLIEDWEITAIKTEGDVGKFISLATNINKDLDTVNERHISFYDATNADLYYGLHNGKHDGDWTFEIVDSAGDVGMFSSLALNATGLPAISYYDAYLGNLKYAATFIPVSNYVFLPLVLKK